MFAFVRGWEKMFAFVLSLKFVFNDKASVKEKEWGKPTLVFISLFLLSEEPNRGGVAAVSIIGCWI